MYTDDMHTHQNRKKCESIQYNICTWYVFGKMSISFELKREKREKKPHTNVRDMQCANLMDCEIQKLDAFFCFVVIVGRYKAVVRCFIVETLKCCTYTNSRQLVFRPRCVLVCQFYDFLFFVLVCLFLFA